MIKPHRLDRLPTILALLLLGLIALFSGCSNSYNPDIERGSDYMYREGYPEFRVSTIGLFDQNDQPAIRVTADIVYGSLIYKVTDDSLFEAKVLTEIQIIDQNNPESVVETKQYSYEITSRNQKIVNRQDTYTFQKTINVAPGDYTVRVILTDQDSNKQTIQESKTYIPDSNEKIPNLTNIEMSGKDVQGANKFSPITTYDVPGRMDSLKFVFQLTNNIPNRRVVIQTHLVKFESDTTIPRPMSFPNYSPSSIQYKGIEYEDETEIESNRRVITQSGNILIEYVFANLDKGNYRFRARVTNIDAPEESAGNIFKARDFSVKSKNYPAVKSPKELARPLYYLMTKKEFENLMAIKDNKKLKEAIDRFWLTNIEDKQTARDVIQKYYERVEEANKQFSNFEEGWKTDLGMVYILFGPPWYIRERLDVMEWSYSYNRNDPNYNYIFQQYKLESRFYPFENYLLQRHDYYYQVEYRQRQLWLTGQILRREQ